MTGARLLERYGGRPMLVAITAMNVITGIAAAVILAPLSYGRDADAFRRGAIALESGQFDRDFLYSPIAGLIARPLTWMSVEAAAAVMLLIGLVVLVVGVVVETRGRATVDRVLVFMAALTFAPVVNELLLGQVTLLIAAAVYLAVRLDDRYVHGIPLGIALALAPKPLLVPILVWMLLCRRHALGGAIATAGVLTLVGLAVMNPDTYQLWINTLTGTGQVSRQGNMSVWGTGLQPIALAAAMLGAATAIWAMLRSEAAGLVAAVLLGLLIAPYTLLYSASIVLVVVVPALALSPIATRLLALVANPAIFIWFAGWLFGGLAAMAAAARHRPIKPSSP